MTPAELNAIVARHDRARLHATAAQASDKCGVGLYFPNGDDKPVTCDLVRCAHCDRVWQFIPGSGRRRGRCGKCKGLLCGGDWCMTLACTAVEQRLENMEAGRAFDFTRPTVSLANLILPG